MCIERNENIKNIEHARQRPAVLHSAGYISHVISVPRKAHSAVEQQNANGSILHCAQHSFALLCAAMQMVNLFFFGELRLPERIEPRGR